MSRCSQNSNITNWPLGELTFNPFQTSIHTEKYKKSAEVLYVIGMSCKKVLLLIVYNYVVTCIESENYPTIVSHLMPWPLL